MENGVITTKISTVWMGEDNIIRNPYFPKVDITLEDAKEIVSASVIVNHSQPCPVLVDTRQVKSISREAREYYAGREANTVYTACAILIGSPVSSMIGNLFLKLNKPTTPVKLFTDESYAIAWLKNFL